MNFPLQPQCPYASHDFPMIFPWFSHDFPMIFPWFSHVFPMIFPWFPHDFSMIFPWISHEFPMISPWFSHDFPMIFPWLSHCFPIVFSWFSHDFPKIFPWFIADCPATFDTGTPPATVLSRLPKVYGGLVTTLSASKDQLEPCTERRAGHWGMDSSWTWDTKTYWNYPLVNCHIAMERSSMLLMGKSTISTGPFSIAMLVHQRV